MSTIRHIHSYGATLHKGDRVELHPACDLWMRGARFGTVVGTSTTRDDAVRLTLDATGAKVWSCSLDMVRPL